MGWTGAKGTPALELRLLAPSEVQFPCYRSVQKGLQVVFLGLFLEVVEKETSVLSSVQLNGRKMTDRYASSGTHPPTTHPRLISGGGGLTGQDAQARTLLCWCLIRGLALSRWATLADHAAPPAGQWQVGARRASANRGAPITRCARDQQPSVHVHRR